MALFQNIDKTEAIYGVIKFYGLALDFSSLPNDGISTSSISYAIDTKATYMYEESTKTWYLQ